jgi:hypothetical protein
MLSAALLSFVVFVGLVVGWVQALFHFFEWDWALAKNGNVLASAVGSFMIDFNS